MKKLGVAWRRDQIHPFESVWAIVHKLCRWNSIKSPEVWQLFALRNRPFETDPQARGTNSLLNPSWLDREALSEVLDLSPAQTRNAFLERYACTSEVEHRKLRGVRYCPACLNIGFHSPLHCAPFLDDCPIHAQPLVDACPKCTRALPYGPPIADAFACRCGHAFWWGVNIVPLGEDAQSGLETLVSELDILRRGVFGHDRINDAPDARVALSNETEDSVLAQYRHHKEQFAEGFRPETKQVSNLGHRNDSNDIEEEDARALDRWTYYWESVDGEKTESESGFDQHIVTRFREIAPIDGTEARNTAPRLMAAACLGTFLECRMRSRYSSDVAARPAQFADVLTGKLLPFCLPNSRGVPQGARALFATADLDFYRKGDFLYDAYQSGL